MVREVGGHNNPVRAVNGDLVIADLREGLLMGHDPWPRIGEVPLGTVGNALRTLGAWFGLHRAMGIEGAERGFHLCWPQFCLFLQGSFCCLDRGQADLPAGELFGQLIAPFFFAVLRLLACMSRLISSFIRP